LLNLSNAHKQPKFRQHYVINHFSLWFRTPLACGIEIANDDCSVHPFGRVDRTSRVILTAWPVLIMCFISGRPYHQVIRDLGHPSEKCDC
jgi:hypothetical protein